MTTPEKIKSKILTPESLGFRLSVWNFKNKKIVFTNGVFDLLHLGHIDYLSQASDMGDILIIGVNTDASVRRLNKGPDRPINNEEQRCHLLAALSFVDAIILFDEDTPLELIRKIKPRVLVKGGDYKPEQIVGSDIVLASGGLVHSIPLLAGYSTTLTEERLKKSTRL
jgi:rfaE bifunctional protein nucleotidyltransferase chain/domain